MHNIINRHACRADLAAGPALAAIEAPLMHQDDSADEFSITLRHGTSPVDVTGAQVHGWLLVKATGTTIPLTGTADGSTVTVTLTDACYAQPGPFTLSVQVTLEGVRRTVWQGEGTILRTGTDSVADPEGVIPTLPELLQQVAALEQAITDAEAVVAEARSTLAGERDAVSDAIDRLDGSITEAEAAVDAQISRTEEAIRSLSAYAAPAIIDTASGPLITLTDGAARPAAALTSAIGAEQEGSGDPSPANIRPIAGRDAVTLFGAGRNLLVLEDESFTRGGVAVTAGQQGLLTFSGTSTLTATATVNLVTMTLPAGAYTLSGTVAGGSLTSNSESATIAFVNVDGTYHRVRKNALSVTFTLDALQTISIGCMVAAGGAVYEDYAVQLQLECGSEATAWQPSAAVSIEAPLPETVYGGVIDWIGGDVTIDRMLISFDGTENWGKNNTVSNTVHLATPGGAASVALCSHYICRPVTPSGNDLSVTIGTQLNFSDSVNAVDVDTWKAYLAAQAAAGTPVTILYAMTDPRSIALDPLSITLIEGENNLWCDCGDTTLSYVADTKRYIGRKLAALLTSAE